MKCLQNSTVSEERLISSAQLGDLEAFNLLILRYQNLLFGIALRLLNDQDTAADAVQEAIISAYRKFDTFRGDSLRSWLARVVVNACYDEMRKKRRQHSVPLEKLNYHGEEIETSYWLIDSDADPQLQFEASELENAIQNSLYTLPPLYRTILVLVDIQGLSYEEAATAAHVPLGTVKSRLARARMQMQKSLQASRELLPAAYQVKLPISV
jgi:RNA polymerase sigma-70 factor (ECF subfamily)